MPLTGSARRQQSSELAGLAVPGQVHVYRLYSSAHFNDNFQQYSQPEIANTPLEGVVLLLKAMGVDKVGDVMLCHHIMTCHGNDLSGLPCRAVCCHCPVPPSLL